jgi:hypothetical protein
MFFGLTFLQSLIVVFVVWEIIISTISALKGNPYNGGLSILFAVLYGIGKLIASS